jgi:DNA repair protein RadD
VRIERERPRFFTAQEIDAVTPARLVPRADQREAHDAVIDALAASVRRPLCVEPCAWGKSLLLAMLAATLSRRGRVLILAHRSELLEQDAGALRRFDTKLDVGICSASLKADRTEARIVVGGIATIYRRLRRVGRFDFALLDEAHLLGPGDASMLGKILAALDNPPLIGLTATPYRTDSGPLVAARLFELIVHQTPVAGALAAGLLVPLRTKAPRAGRIDTTGVHITAGEFNSAELEAAALRGDATEEAVARAVEIAEAEGRKSLLFFAVGVAHALRIADALRQHGVSVGVITGATSAAERADLIARFRAGEIRSLSNCNVLTTGFDATNIDLIAFMRPTVSPVLWVQACGRGMRTHPGKVDCRLLDFGGNLLRHGPIDDVRLRQPGERHDANAAEAKQRICGECDEANPAHATACSACGAPLVAVRAVYVAALESNASALAGPARWVDVVAMRGGIHQKPGRPASFRLSFRTRDEGEITDFLAIEHPANGARWWAARKWGRLSRQRQAPPPATVHEAYGRFCGGELLAPRRIRIEREGGYWRVQDVEVAR